MERIVTPFGPLVRMLLLHARQVCTVCMGRWRRTASYIPFVFVGRSIVLTRRGWPHFIIIRRWSIVDYPSSGSISLVLSLVQRLLLLLLVLQLATTPKRRRWRKAGALFTWFLFLDSNGATRWWPLSIDGDVSISATCILMWMWMCTNGGQLTSSRIGSPVTFPPIGVGFCGNGCPIRATTSG